VSETTQPPVGRRYHPFLALLAARIREFAREPAAIFWVYVFPLILVVALGAAFRNQRVGGLVVAIAQANRAEAIRQTLASESRLEPVVCTADEARKWLKTGRADLMIASDSSGYRYLFDATRANSVLARELADAALQRAAGRQDAVAVENNTLVEPGARYIDFLIPGLVGLGLLGGGLWGVGVAIVDMRIRKLLKRYLATPMKRRHFLGAVMASRLVFTIPEVLLILLFAHLLFGVTSQGSYVSVAVLILLGAFQFSGIGLLVASRAQTIESVSGLMNAVMLPMWIGTGLFFPIERFPLVVQPVLRLLPLTPLNSALRSVMLEGASLLSLAPEIALITLWGAATFAIALRIFRWN
jgi:ABC-type multidrug transport system permease subunit